MKKIIKGDILVFSFSVFPFSLYLRNEILSALARTGRLWQDGISLIDNLVGMTMSSTAHTEMFRILARENLSEAEPAWFWGELKGLYRAGYPHISLKAHRISFLDAVQHLFTNGGPGGGHIVPSKMRQIHDLWKPVYRAEQQIEDVLYAIPYGHALFEKGALTAMALPHAHRDDTLGQMDAIYDELDEIVKLTPYERQRSDRIGAEGIIRADLGYRLRVMHEALLTVVTLQRWTREEGVLPQELGELVRAGCLKGLPIDPFSNRPLAYKKADDGFILYSFGENMKDNGG